MKRLSALGRVPRTHFGLWALLFAWTAIPMSVANANEIIRKAGGTIKSGRAGVAVYLSKQVEYGVDGQPRVVSEANITPAVVAELQKMDNLVALTLRGSQVSDNLPLIMALPGFTTLRAIDLGNTDMPDQFMALVPGMQALELVKMDGCRNLTDAGLGHLADLPALRELDIRSTQMTDDGLKAFENHLKLEKLNLRFTNVTGPGLAHLSLVPSLVMLELGADRSTDDKKPLDLTLLAKGFGALSTFTVGGNTLTDDHLVAISQCQGLQRLTFRTVGHLDFTDAGMANIATLKNLRHLDINGAHKVTDEGIRTICGITTLQSLVLKRTGVSAASAPAIAGLEKLAELNVASTRFDPAGIAHIKAKHPGAKVVLHERMH